MITVGAFVTTKRDYQREPWPGYVLDVLAASFGTSYALVQAENGRVRWIEVADLYRPFATSKTGV